MDIQAPEHHVIMTGLRGSRFRVAGVGGAGCRWAGRLMEAGLEGSGFVALNSDGESLRECPVPHRVQLGARLTRGLGAGGDPEVGRAAAAEAEETIRELCRGAELVFVLAGLGGGTGTGAAPMVARWAREEGALVLTVVTLPFDCEGGRRQRQARQAVTELKEAADVVLTLPNQRVLGLVDESTSLIETLRFADGLLTDAVRGIWRLVSRPGLINVDFADLRELVRGRHVESYFASVEAEGEQRAREVVERLLMSPLVENGALLRESEAALVSLVSGPTLTMAEVNRVGELLRRECEGAELLLGAAVDPSFGNRLSLTFIGTRKSRTRTAGVSAETPVEAEADQPEPDAEDPNVETDFFRREPPPRRPKSRLSVPPPELSLEQREQLLQRNRRARPRLRQTMLPLEVVSKGRFEKSEPTVYRGEDLDVPTFVRRGVVLN